MLDYAAGFSEVIRVLRTGGFTVPLFLTDRTVERVALNGNELEYLVAPIYHDDSIRGSGKVLVYRNYGNDTQCCLKGASFRVVEIIDVPGCADFGFNWGVVVAYK